METLLASCLGDMKNKGSSSEGVYDCIASQTVDGVMLYSLRHMPSEDALYYYEPKPESTQMDGEKTDSTV